MTPMRLDHLSYAAAPDGLVATAARLGDALGERFVDGGVHPRSGTRHMVLGLAGQCYLEVVAVLDHPASDKAAFGQAVRARSLAGGGWLRWVVAVDDITATEQRLGRAATLGSRRRPDGTELTWKQLGAVDVKVDPQLPMFVQWQCSSDQHPSAGANRAVRLTTLEVAGDPARVAEWLGQPATAALDDVRIEWHPPAAATALVAASFTTSSGTTRL